MSEEQQVDRQHVTERTLTDEELKALRALLEEIPLSPGDQPKAGAQWTPEDKIRGLLTFGLAACLFVVLAISGWVAAVSGWQAIKEWIPYALSGVTGLLGTVVGFYFGQSTTKL